MGRKKWKEKHKYHRMSISETAMYRLKTLLGDKLSSREFQRQANEVLVDSSNMIQLLKVSINQKCCTYDLKLRDINEEEERKGIDFEFYTLLPEE